MIGVAPNATRPSHARRLTALARTLLLAAVLLGYALTARAETVFWFDDGLYPVDSQARASYRLSVADERDGIGWPAELRRIEDDALRMRGTVARPEPGDTDVTWIGAYQLYRMAGEHRLAEVGTTDAQARQQGLVTTFDEQGRLESETLYRDGKRHGEARRYLDGELSTLTHYTHGQRDGCCSALCPSKACRKRMATSGCSANRSRHSPSAVRSNNHSLRGCPSGALTMSFQRSSRTAWAAPLRKNKYSCGAWVVSIPVTYAVRSTPSITRSVGRSAPAAAAAVAYISK